MKHSELQNNRRIAKNTLALYVRMLFLMLISLYTSRVILEILGIEDFGIYNVVGGFVALLAVVSRTLSSSTSRFMNFEMGSGDNKRLSNVFSTALVIHFFLAVVVAVFVEAIGVWFVNNKLVIPDDRLYAANWVFQFSVFTFCTHLFIVPYHAAIIAHEKMGFYAYLGIFEGISKLLICYMLLVSPVDRLIMYSILMFLIQIFLLLANRWFCKTNFLECDFKWSYDKKMLKEIFGFASWNMIGSSAVVFRNQGGNILINLFFGPAVNAARAVANQVLHAVNAFVESFFTALRPQITISYANKNWDYMMTLIFQGARLSYYMLLLFCLPILINTDFILNLWLKEVPDYSVSLVQLTLVFTMVESISSTLITAQSATGKIRDYQIVVGSFQLLNIPLCYIFLRLGGSPETILYVAIFIAVCCLVARLYMLRKMIPINVRSFTNKVIVNVVLVTVLSVIIPWTLKAHMDKSFLTFIVMTIVCLLSSIMSILYVGCKPSERHFVYSKISKIYERLSKSH